MSVTGSKGVGMISHDPKMPIRLPLSSPVEMSPMTAAPKFKIREKKRRTTVKTRESHPSLINANFQELEQLSEASRKENYLKKVVQHSHPQRLPM
jgi:hypothetical protein